MPKIRWQTLVRTIPNTHDPLQKIFWKIIMFILFHEMHTTLQTFIYCGMEGVSINTQAITQEINEPHWLMTHNQAWNWSYMHDSHEAFHMLKWAFFSFLQPMVMYYCSTFHCLCQMDELFTPKELYLGYYIFSDRKTSILWGTCAFPDSSAGAMGAAIKKILKIFLYSKFNIFYIKNSNKWVEFLIKKQLFMIFFNKINIFW